MSTSKHTTSQTDSKDMEDYKREFARIANECEPDIRKLSTNTQLHLLRCIKAALQGEPVHEQSMTPALKRVWRNVVLPKINSKS